MKSRNIVALLAVFICLSALVVSIQSSVTNAVTVGQTATRDSTMASADNSITSSKVNNLTQLWSKTFEGGVVDTPNSIIQTNDGGFAIAGQSEVPLTYTESGLVNTTILKGWLLKVDNLGNLQFQKSYGDSQHPTSLNSVVQTSDGGFALAGESSTSIAGIANIVAGNSERALLIKTDSQGNVEWNKTYDGPYSGISVSKGSAAVQTKDGGYALAGFTYDIDATQKFWLIKTDSQGNAQWNQTYQSIESYYGCHLLQTNDGGFALAGPTTIGEGSNREMVVSMVKVDSSGKMEWQKNYPTSTKTFGTVDSFIQTNDNGYLLGGPSGYLFKTDSNGNTQWNHTYKTQESLVGILQDPDGGYTMLSSTCRLFKIDSKGNELWSQTFTTQAAQGSISHSSNANALTRATNGSCAFAGIDSNTFKDNSTQSSNVFNQHYLVAYINLPETVPEIQPIFALLALAAITLIATTLVKKKYNTRTKNAK
jgi:hypothetical protein